MSSITGQLLVVPNNVWNGVAQTRKIKTVTCYLTERETETVCLNIKIYSGLKAEKNENKRSKETTSTKKIK